MRRGRRRIWRRGSSRLDLAKNDLQRAENLKGTRAISEEEYDSRSKAAREAEAALLASKAAEATAQLNLDYTRVKSPINGRIGRRLVTAGNLVQGGGAAPATMLATLVSVDPIDQGSVLPGWLLLWGQCGV